MSLVPPSGRLHPGLALAVHRFPFAILAASLATVGLLSLISISGDQRIETSPWKPDDVMDVLFALVLSFFTAVIAAFAASGQSVRVRFLAEGTGFLIGFSFLYWVKLEDDTAPSLLFACLCFMSVAAGIAARRGVSGFWFANAHLIASLAIGLIALGVVLAGGAILYFTIDTLLGDTLPGWPIEKLGTALGTIVIFFAFPLLWLTLVAPIAAEPIRPDHDNLLLRIIAVLTDALLVPLTSIFGGVLHLYALRIAVTGEMPKGQIGTIVPLYLVLGYGTYLLASGPHAPLARVRSLFRASWLASTLVPLALLTLAIGIRVSAYGITEERYWLILVIIGAGFLLASVLVRRPFDIRLVPLTGGILTLVAVIGPLSAEKVTFYSQSARTQAPQTDADALDSSAKPSSDVSALTGPETFDFTQPAIIRAGTVTILNDFAVDFDQQRSHTIRSFSTSVTLTLEGQFLTLEGDTWTSRFDLSPLLTMDGRALADLDSTLHSVKGREGDFVLSRFQRTAEPTGDAIRHLRGTVILH
ncbi:DUF4153 domain-containing protein [Microvirga sp. TS319]|uniref:DUF4153 domain-containing protein n=1 Tax=Microvirga sp. TS319 TaxID=3241165 RepID=UPI00351A683D